MGQVSPEIFHKEKEKNSVMAQEKKKWWKKVCVEYNGSTGISLNIYKYLCVYIYMYTY